MQNVRFWHKADIELARINVRFWGNSGHRRFKAACLLLTQSGHPSDVGFQGAVAEPIYSSVGHHDVGLAAERDLFSRGLFNPAFIKNEFSFLIFILVATAGASDVCAQLIKCNAHSWVFRVE